MCKIACTIWCADWKQRCKKSCHIILIVSYVLESFLASDPEAIKIEQNQLLQTLESWGPTFTISVEIKITSFEEQEAGHWGEILRLASRPGDCCLNGQRVPAVFLSSVKCSIGFNQINVVLEPYSRSFYITTSIGNNFDKKFSINGLEENTWYKMVLSQRKIGVWTLKIIIKKFLFYHFFSFFITTQTTFSWMDF